MRLTKIIELDAVGLEVNYLVIDDLDSITGWSAGSLDAVHFRSGAGSVKLTAVANATTTSSKALGGNVNLTGYSQLDQIRFWAYVDVIANLSQLQVKLTDASAVTAVLTVAAGALVQGWNRVSLPKTSFTNYLTLDWSKVTTEVLAITASAAGTVNVSFDMLRVLPGPTIGYTMGKWNETTGLADVVDHHIAFFDTGYWELLDPVVFANETFYRKDSDSLSTVIIVNGSVRISGNTTFLKTLELFISDTTGKDRLIFFQPQYYNDSKIMDAIRTAQGYEVGRSIAQVLESFRQDFADWSTYDLKRHEQEMGVGAADAANFSWTKRRRRIKARYQLAFLPMNVVGMRTVVQSYVNVAVVTESPSTYTFAVQIVDPKGTPPNIVEIQNAIEQAKPAHLGYTITYTFTTWDQMDGYNRTWDSAEAYTWDGFEVS